MFLLRPRTSEYFSIPSLLLPFTVKTNTQTRHFVILKLDFSSCHKTVILHSDSLEQVTADCCCLLTKLLRRLRRLVARSNRSNNVRTFTIEPARLRASKETSNNWDYQTNENTRSQASMRSLSRLKPSFSTSTIGSIAWDPMRSVHQIQAGRETDQGRTHLESVQALIDPHRDESNLNLRIISLKAWNISRGPDRMHT